ncbi:5,10-methylenetetrahydromethanopterin reductase [Saccharothrix tamanrassetensis]|uniref:5,10-methylenetetrahydromethanopterin reductase n=1 Tax=Saccharothrix tamanrassetensis TaxID=1051531 RepID=A0A841CR15_9PSEU|nr:LLM class flavin-dependent oxidoreductase [Saccharothrix tamanrassetensis]MBB5959739.1 5,10-methylenetetrahydromethanopterin reductase [Saccharothrix tamanrassetensis]
MVVTSIRLTQFVGGPAELVGLAVTAEEAGFDQVWFASDPFMLHTWALCTAVAQRTSRIHVGALGMNPGTVDPSEIAAYLGTLDLLSGGRALAGIGAHTDGMIPKLGLDGTAIPGRTAEAVRLIRALIAGEEAPTDGEHFRWEPGCTLGFTPPRRRIPLYVTAYGEDFLTAAGGYGDGVLPILFPPETAPEVVGWVHAGAAAAGRDPSEVDIAGCVWVSVADDPTVAGDLIRPTIAFFGPYLSDRELAVVGLGSADFAPVTAAMRADGVEAAAELVTDDMLRLAVVGTPAEVVARLRRLVAAGVTQLSIGGPLGPDPGAAIRLLGEQVLPVLG